MIFDDLKKILERLDLWRNKILYFFLRPLWPSFITPNQISWFRIGLGIWLSVLLFWLGVEERKTIISIFFIGILTDFIDGPIARCKNKVTELGIMLDPIADRILIMPIALYSLFNFHKWLLLWIIIIEVIEGMVTLLAKSKKLSIESNIYGKTKMVLQSLVFVAILFVWPKPPFQILIDALWLSIPLCLLSILHKLNEAYKFKSIRI